MIPHRLLSKEILRNCEIVHVNLTTSLLHTILCIGYIGDEESTSAILNSEGWLRTGDLCYINDEGFLFIIDRLKELIKYKGYQVITEKMNFPMVRDSM